MQTHDRPWRFSQPHASVERPSDVESAPKGTEIGNGGRTARRASASSLRAASEATGRARKLASRRLVPFAKSLARILWRGETPPRASNRNRRDNERYMPDDQERSLEEGFLEPLGPLTPEQIEQACEAALANAVDLLEEGDLLRANNRCARAYFLAHIACEELGKLPILTTAAVSQHIGHDVDWKRIDRVLRDHAEKIKKVLFMDSIVGGEGLAAGAAAYEADVARMRVYTDAKNASLYSFPIEGQFARPLDAFPCEFYDSFRPLAEGRRNAFEAMYLKPLRDLGGLRAFLERMDQPHFRDLMTAVTGEEGRQAFDADQQTGDESHIRALFDRLLGDAAAAERTRRDGGNT